MIKDVKTLSLKAFTHLFSQSGVCNRRFCFILGSGASREAGILTGVEMAKLWAEELKEKYEEDELKRLMNELNIDSIEPNSKNYFGIYDLLFYPDYQEGQAYFERELEKGNPSLGHETLTEFINLNIDSPIVAKIHQSLYFHPFNRQQETAGLADGWHDTLKNAFMVYTPVVIGYAGGDQSLMAFLQDGHIKMNGLYWCYWSKEEPSDEIQELVRNKNGCFVPIDGFDQMMFMLSRKLGFQYPEEEMRQVTQDRIDRYNEQYEGFEERIREAANTAGANQNISNTLKEIDTANQQKLEEANRRIEKEKTAENFLPLCLQQPWVYKLALPGV